MGFRFRKSIKILPGIRLNLSKSGASLSVGGRGASVNIGPRGTYGNIGLPGTGLSYRERLDASNREAKSRSPFQDPKSYQIKIENDSVVIVDEEGRLVSGSIRKKLIEENHVAIKIRLEEIANERNLQVEKALHSSVTKVRMGEAKPQAEPGESASSHMARVGEWRAKMANSSEERLVDCLKSIEWGKEPDIICGIANGEVRVQVQLPGIESVPTARYKVEMSPVPRIAIRRSTGAQRNEIYTRYICSIVMAVADAIIIAMPEMKNAKIEARRQGERGSVIAALEVIRGHWRLNEVETDSLDRFLQMGGIISPGANGKLAAVKSILK